jgi:hypothetical protein
MAGMTDTFPIEYSASLPEDVIVVIPFELRQRGLLWDSLTNEEREKLESDLLQAALRKELWVIKNVRFD